MLITAIAEMQQAQLLMVAGFVMLGWVLARRHIKMRRRSNQQSRAANRAIRKIREHKEPAVPLADAPPETQRWQVAMFDLQRELKAELDTRIAIVQTLLRQVDQRIERLSALEASLNQPTSRSASGLNIDPQTAKRVGDLAAVGFDASEIAGQLNQSIDDVEQVIQALRQQGWLASPRPNQSSHTNAESSQLPPTTSGSEQSA